MEYLTIIGGIEKGNKYMSANCMFYNKKLKKSIKLYFKDSLCMIPKKLGDFGRCFGLKQQKEIMPYKLYNDLTVKVNKVQIKKALRFIEKSQRKEFIKNIDRWNLRVDEDSFYHMSYAIMYCKMDCVVLKEGYEKFAKWMFKVTKMNIENKISISSLAHDFLISQKCYEGVKQISGTPREFIQRCIVGGRCMTRLNKKYHVKKELQDFDAVSLYPSAMCRMKGFLKGSPRVIKNHKYNNIKNYDGYFVEIKINKINKHLPFPLLSTVDKDGIRVFKDYYTKEQLNNLTFFVDKITLEDLIEYQQINFKVLRGYYFNDGFNPKIKNVIKYLFDEKLKKKKDKNPIQEVYKLIMNSAYGKTIMKPIETENKFFNTKKQTLKYVLRNSNYIKYFTKLAFENDKYMVKKIKSINQHFSIPQVGCEILSMSKRIMNEVICLANDNNINIYYQDTDSMHIENNKIELLKQKYYEKYGRELDGKNLGQFHCDFDFKHDEGKLPVSVESYFLGKKCYIDKVISIENNEEKVNHHIRMKGVPSKSVLADYDKPMELYDDLANGEERKFDLLKGCVGFDFRDDYSIYYKKSFKRKLKFPGNLIKISK